MLIYSWSIELVRSRTYRAEFLFYTIGICCRLPVQGSVILWISIRLSFHYTISVGFVFMVLAIITKFPILRLTIAKWAQSPVALDLG
jgi:hypothetical protein